MKRFVQHFRFSSFPQSRALECFIGNVQAAPVDQRNAQPRYLQVSRRHQEHDRGPRVSRGLGGVPVHPQRPEHGRKRGALIAVDENVTLRDVVAHGCHLGEEGAVGIFTPRAFPGSIGSALQRPAVFDSRQPTRQLKDIGMGFQQSSYREEGIPTVAVIQFRHGLQLSQGLQSFGVFLEHFGQHLPGLGITGHLAGNATSAGSAGVLGLHGSAHIRSSPRAKGIT